MKFASLALIVILPFIAGCPEFGRDVETDRGAEARVDRPEIPVDGFRDVVQGALPSIVFIQAEATPPPGLELLIPRLGDLPDGPMPVGVGSGVIFRDDGYILTNNHVVRDAERVRVVLHDRRHFEAEVIGRDPSTEVAVVRIRGNDLHAARLGDSDAIALGDFVLAMGSPLGLDFSVTAGIISGMGRAVGIIGQERESEVGETPPLEHFIQTDAALSPGNSGGPLMNTRGEVIGINTAIAVQPGAPVSIGFAIPSNLAHRVAEQLIRYGEVRRPYLGVALAAMSPALAEEHGLERVEGAAVMRVEPGSPADEAGIQANDVILGIGDERIVTVSDLQARLAAIEPGSRVQLQLYRQGREVEVTARLGEVRSGSSEPRGQPVP
jgi:serine protease Do